MIPENSTTVDYGLIINATEYAEMTGLNSGEKRALPVTDEEASGIDGMMVFGFVAMALAGVIIVVGVSLYVNKVRRKPESSCTNVEASSRVLAN